MIIGSGSLAKLLKDREGAILFASGVGNSQCNDTNQFSRESDLLKSTKDDGRCLFYFSSMSVFEDSIWSPYTFHKKTMEIRVTQWFQNYNIIRLGNIWECTNRHTFRNAIRAKKAKGDPVDIRDEWKYMIHADQLNMIVQGLPLTGGNEISIFGERLRVEECL
jgi:hypothetical protein